MRIHRIINKTYAEGPGCRFCIWVQGCNHKCKGCFAEKLWDYNGGYECDENEIIKQFQEVSSQVCGITFLGGEPFDKAKSLAKIAKKVRELNKNVITFTGYSYQEIKNANKEDWNELLKYTDLLIDGEFKKELLDYSRPLVRSSNQNFIFLTDAISKQELEEYKNKFEVRIDKNGNIVYNGMGNIETLKKHISKIKCL